MHTLLRIVECLAFMWFGCGTIAFLKGLKYGLGSVIWIPLGPIGLIYHFFGNV